MTSAIDELPQWQTVEEVEAYIAGVLPLLATMEYDPRNPRRSGLVMGDRPEDQPGVSSFDGPRSDPDPELQPGMTLGKLSEHRLPSRILNEDIRIWFHVPGSWDGASELGLLVQYDGQVQRDLVTTITENLNAVGYGPFATVLVDSVGIVQRHRYLGPRDDFVDFIAQELVPWVGEQVPRSGDQVRTVVAGASLGGFAAMYTAFRHPKVFGGFLAQSPSLHISKDKQRGWLFELAEEADALPVRAFLQAGVLETFIIGRLRQLRDILRSRGVDVGYREVMTGHDNFAATSVEGLRFLFRAE
jgi:enterochelin esterase family protein